MLPLPDHRHFMEEDTVGQSGPPSCSQSLSGKLGQSQICMTLGDLKLRRRVTARRRKVIGGAQRWGHILIKPLMILSDPRRHGQLVVWK